MTKFLVPFFGLVPLFLTRSFARHADTGIDKEITTPGTWEVTGRLAETQAPFLPNDLYNYAFVLKYKVLTVRRGKALGDEIRVGHYNPPKTRASAQEEFSGKVGFQPDAFRAHPNRLEQPLGNLGIGRVVDKYFNEKGVRFRAVWANPHTV